MRRAWLALVLAPVLTLGAPCAAPAQPTDAGDALDARIRDSEAAAQALQGPLDGGWTLVSAAGRPIYAFEFVDRAGGRDPLEGVWRDLRRPAAPGDIGVVDSLRRDATSLTLGFAPAVTVSLRLGPDGAWTGELREGGTTTPVALMRVVRDAP